MKSLKKIFFVLLIGMSVVACRVKLEPVEILSFKQELEQLFPEAVITKMEAKDHFERAYQLVLKQPLDHKNPSAGYFEHYVYLSHVDEEMPVVLVTEGYHAYPRTYELSKIFKGNQVQVEYRFYGKSRPDTIPWQYLTNDQAIEDYHSIVSKLKKLYVGKWISTGISKGGETVLIYKSKYPWDVEIAVPYVAPLIDGQEDPRTEEHIKTVGTKECRDRITAFQRAVLSNREEAITAYQHFATEKGMSYTIVPIEEALEYAVLEFPFSFWQWGGKCEEIPGDDASGKEQMDYINSIFGLSFYNDKTYYDLLPSYYQHMVELGYYGFDTTPVKDLIQVVHEPTNLRFAPKDVDLTYNPNYIKEVRDYVENKGKKILYIYGEYDTWGACAPTPKPHVDALKMVLAKASHRTRIKNFPPEDQERIYEKLRFWLGYGVKVHPLE